MQIVVNKVENGYIITLNGKMYVMRTIDEVYKSMAFEFEKIDVDIRNVLIPQKQNESTTSDSSEV
jgi:hypothetical protein